MRKRSTDGQAQSNGSAADEPIGIVISNGDRGEATPKFAAYVWGPVPDGETVDAELIAVA